VVGRGDVARGTDAGRRARGAAGRGCGDIGCAWRRPLVRAVAASWPRQEVRETPDDATLRCTTDWATWAIAARGTSARGVAATLQAPGGCCSLLATAPLSSPGRFLGPVGCAVVLRGAAARKW